MSRVYSFFCCLSLLLGSATAETIVPGGNVFGTWTSAGSPYVVQGTITIQAVDSLIISPGVEVRFEPNVNMTVNGSLQANGVSGDSIRFTSNLPNPQPGSWGSLRIINGGRADLNFCCYDYGTYVWGYENNSFNFNDCRFSMLVSGEPYYPTFNRCLFTNDQTFTGGRWLVMRSCVINGILNFDMGSGHSFTIDSCSIAEDLWLYNYAATFNVSASSIGGNVDFVYHATAYLTNCQIQGCITGGDNLYVDNCTIHNGISMQNIDESGHLYLDNSEVYGTVFIGDRIYNDVNGNTIIGNIELLSCMGLNLLNNSISGSLTGYVSPMDGALNVRNNTITNGKINVRTDFTEIGAQVINNQILNSPGDGIRLVSTTWQNGDPISIINNTVYTANGNGITVIDSGSTAHQIALVNNNIVSNCGGYGVYVANLDSVYLAYNTAWSCNSGQYYGAAPGVGSLSIDPLFVDPAASDFHLQSQQGSYHNGQWLTDPQTSLCIDAGDPSSLFSNEPMPNGGRINMGFEGNTSEASHTYTNPGISGPVSGTWTLAGSPYIVIGDITVPANDSLLIEPGVEIRFAPNTNMTVYGYLRTDGIVGDSVNFTSNLPNPQPGSWGSLRVRDGCSADLNFCAFEYGTLLFGFNNQYLNVNDSRIGFPLACESGPLTLNRCLVPNNQTFNGGQNIVLRTTNFGGVLEFLDGPGSGYIVDSCSIAQDLYLYDYAATFYVSNTIVGGDLNFVHHGTGYIRGCTITGQVTGGDNIYINGCTIVSGIYMDNFGEFGSLNLDSSEVYGGIVSSDMIYNYLNDNTITGDVQMDYPHSMNLSGNTINGSLTGALSSMGVSFNVLNNRFINGGVNVLAPFVDVDVSIKNNMSINSPGDGIRLTASSSYFNYPLIVQNNTICGAAGNGIALIDSNSGGFQNAVIRNNIVTNSGGYGVITTQVDSVALTNNDVWSSASGNYFGATPGTGSISINPLFVNPAAGDFHLQSQQGSYHNGQWQADSLTSLCIDAGDPTSPFANEPMPNGGRINMGFEGNTAEASKSFYGGISGPVSGTWTAANSPYYIGGQINVPSGQTLTIQPGVEVIFLGHYKFIVSGILNAIGTVMDSIKFTSVFPDSGWHGLRFSTANDTCHFAYCILEKGSSWGYEIDHEGGAVYSDHSKTVFSHCRFSNNSAMTGGAIALFWYSNMILDHCVITDNYSDWGGGVFTEEYSRVTITNCTIVGNTGNMMGGGIRCTGQSGANISNTIVAGNFGNGGVHWGPTLTSTITFSDFFDNENGNFVGTFPPGMGVLTRRNANLDSCDTYFNIQLDPSFVSAQTGNYHLQTNSPCIDAGNPASPHDPDNSVVDMGAFYYDQIPTITMTPINPPIQIPRNGGSFQYNINVHNTSTIPQNMDIWIMMKQLPDGNWTGPYLSVNRTLGSGANPTRLRTQFISSGLGTGTYLYEGRVGDYPNTIWSFSNFTFEKLAVDDGGPWVVDFANTGLDLFDEFIPVMQVEIPTEYSLSQNYPNPFNPETTISFGLPMASRVNLSVYDISGRLVTTIVNGWREAGNHQVTYNGIGLTSGVYIYRLQAGEFTTSGKMVMVK